MTVTLDEHDALRTRHLRLLVLVAEVRNLIGLKLVPPHAIDENVLSALRQTLQAKDSVIRSLTARCASQSDLLTRRSEKANR